MKFAKATKFYRKSGVAEWSDLRFQLFVRLSSPREPAKSANKPALRRNAL
jgi:hypothetical protein